MGRWVASFLFGLVLAAVAYSLIGLSLRLHLTQQAYAFEELIDYERSLKEEQRRLESAITEKLSPEALQGLGLQEPLPQQLVRIP